MSPFIRGVLLALLLIHTPTCLLAQERVLSRQGVPERFSTFTFNGARGSVPQGWERGWAPDGDLRMRPAGLRTFWLDIAVTKVSGVSRGASTQISAASFLRNMHLTSDAACRAITDDKAVAVADEQSTDKGWPVRSRTWYVMLFARADSAYFVVATATQEFQERGQNFDHTVIAEAEYAVLNISIEDPRHSR